MADWTWLKQLPKGAPVPTRIKKGIEGAEESKRRAKVKEVTLPALDTQALSQKYGPEQATKGRPYLGTFKAPCAWREGLPEFEALKIQKIAKLYDALRKLGFEVIDSATRVAPGIYPHFDLKRGVDDWEFRDWMVGVIVYQRHPKLLRVEIEPELIAPVTLKA